MLRSAASAHAHRYAAGAPRRLGSEIAGFLAAAGRGLGRRIDLEAAIYAAKVAAASLLALYAAFLLNLGHTFWALITIPFIVRPQAGLTVWRSVARLLGTIIGAAVGLCFVAAFAQTPGLMVASLAAWLFAMGFMARYEVGTDAYVYGVAGLTALVVAIDTGPAADTAFNLAVLRSTETIIGIMAAFTVVLIISPRSVEPALMATIDRIRLELAQLMRQALQRQWVFPIALRQKVSSALVEIHTTLRAYRLERGGNMPPALKVAAVANDLARVVVAKEMLARALNGCLESLDDPAVVRGRGQLQRLLAELEPVPATAAEARASARRLRDFEAGLPQRPEMARALVEPLPTELGDPVQRVVLLHRFGYLADAMAQLFEATADLLDPEARPARVERLHLRYRDPLAAFQAGLRPALTFAALAAFWIVSAWPDGGTLTMLAGVTSLVIPMLTPRAAIPTAGMKLGAGIFVMAVPVLVLLARTPSMGGPADLVLLLAPVIFVLYYICSAPANLPIALGGMILLAVGYQPTNLPDISGASYFNTVAALGLLPLALQTALTVFFPEDVPRLRRRLRQGSDRLLRRSLKDSTVRRWVLIAEYLDLLADYGDALHPEEPRDAHLIERARATMLAAIELARLDDWSPALPPALRKRIQTARLAAVAASRRTVGRAVKADLDCIDEAVEDARGLLARQPCHGQLMDSLVGAILALGTLRCLVAQDLLALPEGSER